MDLTVSHCLSTLRFLSLPIKASTRIITTGGHQALGTRTSTTDPMMIRRTAGEMIAHHRYRLWLPIIIHLTMCCNGEDRLATIRHIGTGQEQTSPHPLLPPSLHLANTHLLEIILTATVHILPPPPHPANLIVYFLQQTMNGLTPPRTTRTRKNLLKQRGSHLRGGYLIPGGTIPVRSRVTPPTAALSRTIHL
ncbi:hypothetical protein ABW20_dc0108924 [Dactylellina cionopaga]|nr:hypothetical protein ABW20_dc0108924 [Dactylellina cionopaga]